MTESDQNSNTTYIFSQGIRHMQLEAGFGQRQYPRNMQIISVIMQNMFLSITRWMRGRVQHHVNEYSESNKNIVLVSYSTCIPTICK